MMSGNETREQYVPVICPTCGTRMHAPIKAAGRHITCPDCHVKSRVPKEAAAPKAKPRNRKSPGTYGLAEPWSSETDTSSEIRDAGEGRFLVQCPKCFTRLHPRIDQAGERSRCPDCGTKFRIPVWQPPPKHKVDPAPTEEYGMGQAAKRPALPERFVQPRAIEEREPDSAPPRWTFFSGVFQFPWYPNARLRWGYVTVGFLLIELLVAAAAYLSGYAGGGLSSSTVVGGGALMLAAMVIAVITFSLAADCIVRIVEETAAGADEVEEWPVADWRQWMPSFLTLAYLFLLSGALGYGIDWALSFAIDPQNLAVRIVPLLVFPVLVLSALECGDTIAPISPPVLASLFRQWWVWGLFYILAAAMAIGLDVSSRLLMDLLPLLALIYFPPAGAAVTLIYARLLGRLAWRITYVERSPRDAGADSREPDGRAQNQA